MESRITTKNNIRITQKMLIAVKSKVVIMFISLTKTNIVSLDICLHLEIK